MGSEPIGRDEELAAIDRFLEEALPNALLLEGGAGIGKTTLWQAGIERAHQGGHTVLRARPVAIEGSLSLAGLCDLLADVPLEVRDDLPEKQRRALAVAVAEEPIGEAQLDSRVLGVAVIGLLRALARKGPLLVAVDDLQWLDEASGAVLVYAFRRLGTAGVRLLIACRSDPGQPLPYGFERAFDEGSLVRIPLGPLSEGAIRRLLRVRLGIGLSRTEMHALHEAVGGNPFFALEVGRAGLELDDDGSIRLPNRLEGLVGARIRSLPARTREGLLFVAALVDGSEQALTRCGVRERLRPAFDADVLEQHGGRVRFTHPLLGVAVWSDADVARRRRVHLTLADAVDDPEQRSLHLAAASNPPDARISALLEEAAARALRRGAPAAAAELFDRARSFTPGADVDRWAGLAWRAAIAHAESGHWDAVQDLVELARTRLPAGSSRAAMLATVAQMRPGLVDQFRQAVLEAGETPVGVQARIGLTLQSGLLGRWEEAVDAAQSAARLAGRLGERALLGAALVWVGGFKLMDSRLDGWQDLEQALQIEEELGGLPVPVFHSARGRFGVGLVWGDEPARARPLLEERLATARAEGDEISALQCMEYLVLADVFAGDWAAAAVTGRAAEALAETLDYGYGLLAVRSALAALRARLGELDRARALAVESIAAFEGLGERFWSTTGLAALVLVEVCSGNPEAAVGHAETINARSPKRECWWSHHQGDEIEALVLAGDHERAIARVGALRRAGEAYELPRLLAWAERGAGLVHAAEGDLAAAQCALEASLRHHKRYASPFGRARTLLAYGNVLRRGRHRRVARAVLGDALATFERLGARHFEAVAHEELKHLGGRPRPASTSSPERRRGPPTSSPTASRTKRSRRSCSSP